MMRRSILLSALGLALVVGLMPTTAFGDAGFRPGSAGVGDPYFPLDGNGGYDVRHYGLRLRFDPATDVLVGVATIRAEATQGLSAFNLDLDGLTVRSITVDGAGARWHRARGELTVRPGEGIPDGARFVVVIRYDGVPITLGELWGPSGFMHTDDGAVVLGQPHVASTWFPANDHPIDKASFDFRISVPRGLEAVANGVLVDRSTAEGWTTWVWRASEPMVTYLAAMGVGQYDLQAYRRGAIRYWDAVDPTLLKSTGAPRTGSAFALSLSANSAYKRLSRTIAVPTGGAQLTFWVDRATEPGWDYFFVEARTAGGDDWTTLPDANGHALPEGPFGWVPEEHPFLEHYVTCHSDPWVPCDPTGTTGAWWGVSGTSDGWEPWTVDLSAWAGQNVEVSLSVVSDFAWPMHGVFVDDVVVSTGPGTTSFETDGNTWDGWFVPGAPAGSVGNENDWIVGTEADAPANFGVVAGWSIERQPEILAFEAGLFGPYPFEAAGGVIEEGEFGFALEVQTRPFYSKYFFVDPNVAADWVFVHELAHQWVGDSLAVETWSEIWLNEGFASYAEWLWYEHEGLATAQEIFDATYAAYPQDDPYWTLTIGDPGPDQLFDWPVYERGAMTLHQLRVTVGDEAFFEILRTWVAQHAGGNVNTAQFIELSESISGQELDDLFEAWLFTGAKPAVPGASSAQARVEVRAELPTTYVDALRRLQADGR